MKNTPNAVTRVGTTTAPRCPVQPKVRISMKSGMMPSCVGTARVATTKTISPTCPRKRSLANAKPARVEKVSTETVMTPDTRRLLSIACQNATVSKTCAALVQNCPPGSSGGQVALRVAEPLDPTTNDHHSG